MDVYDAEKREKKLVGANFGESCSELVALASAEGMR
jgi:hypothetical protein